MTIVALNLSGIGTGESGTITVASGQIVRARFTAFDGSAALRMKIVAGGNTSYVDVTNKQIWASPALNGDTVSLVFDGQGNPASNVQGWLETVTL